MLFRLSGSAAPATDGAGFLFDNVLLSSASAEPCAFSISGSTITLLNDCTTDQTILVPDGKTLDGAGNSITAVDPTGGHFLGAVVKNEGASASVENLEITASRLANICDAGDSRLRGILLDGASGSITNNRVIGLRQVGSGCQEGNAIEVRNAPFDTTGADVTANISANTVSAYQKTGIVVNGSVQATVTNNVVVGLGPVDYIAQNGIQVGFGGSAFIRGNTVTGNSYSPASDTG